MSSMQTPSFAGASTSNVYAETPGTVRSTYNAETPSGAAGFTTASYASESDQYMESDSDWLSTDIMVTITGGSSSHLNQIGIIVGVREGGNVEVRVEGVSIVLDAGNLQPVRASKRDRVKIIRGEWKDELGTLMGIDGGDGIVRLDGKGAVDFKIIRLKDIAKIEK